MQAFFKANIDGLREYINSKDGYNHTALFYAIDRYLSFGEDISEIIHTLLERNRQKITQL